jgi:YidC/Oxa1 family membrane protein insertase
MVDVFIGMVRAAVFVAAHLLGGSIGAGIVAVSLAVRLGLLPLTLRLARRAAARQMLHARLLPELTRLRERYRRHPKELWRRTQALYRRSGYRHVDPQGFLGGLLQVPILAAVYGAVRRGLGVGASFLWVADLARPDAVLALAVATLAALATFLGVQAGPQPHQAATQAAVSGVFTLLLFSRASSALLLSWTGSALGNLVQGLVLWRGRRRGPPVSHP